ncbi:MAG: dTDP-4-dehydrorhamnose reductase [bacterium]
MNILLFGANGQLGSDIVRLWNDPEVRLVGLTRADGDVTDPDVVRKLMAEHRPDVVINTTAFHNLPVCEAEPETCFRVNVVGGRNIAAAAAEVGAAIVQLSTDYVFDGEKRSPYLESDARAALNVYGSMKIATEDVVRQANPDHMIVRVSGLYGLAGSAGKGGNFVETMLRLAREGNPIRVVADQTTAPTNTAEIAEGLLVCVKDGIRGVVHLAPEDGTTWHDFASAIFGLAGVNPDLVGVTTAERNDPVQRPMYSVLGSSRAPQLRHWQSGLERYMHEKHGLPR